MKNMYECKDQYDHTAHFQHTQATGLAPENEPVYDIDDVNGRVTKKGGGDYGLVAAAGMGVPRVDAPFRPSRYQRPPGV